MAQQYHSANSTISQRLPLPAAPWESVKGKGAAIGVGEAERIRLPPAPTWQVAMASANELIAGRWGRSAQR